MAETLQNALLITLIGMGLVFVVIIMLWGLMSLLVRLGSEKEDHGEAEEEAENDDTLAEPAETVSTYDAGKPQAAAAAVAIALALSKKQKSLVNPFDHPSTTTVSAWQAAGRANQIKTKQTRGRAL
ncbi:MAG: OadG family protein [Anaerolineaceae bacterium]